MDSHHNIFSKIAAARVNVVYGKKKAEIDEALLTIKSAFRKEERGFVRHNMPTLDIDTHTASHNEFERTVNVFMDEADGLESLPDAKCLELENYMKAWVDYHEEQFDNFAQSFIRLREFSL